MRNICSPLQTVETQRSSRYERSESITLQRDGRTLEKKKDSSRRTLENVIDHEGRLRKKKKKRKKKRTDHKRCLKMGLIKKDVFKWD